ncbi:hypothetical protein FOXG_00345 [Fusarium oxysporum f. sp. lycopersici 4287]|uniref:Uncharacterized protein n=2 Tax=Fusarium oxysporum TaxID=5507 RepID=A0A0J9U5W4_FUSO4|nr:hypothetical protein FOXG_00345 [Fusarium oxysporum f. sp. lycopersici 4287]KNA94187.1 hypothetical protein FOXG_00345 [Fusarium oxysporum f. sp. lycopersici 4287]
MTLGINETAMIPPSRALEITPRNAPVNPDCLLVMNHLQLKGLSFDRPRLLQSSDWFMSLPGETIDAISVLRACACLRGVLVKQTPIKQWARQTGKTGHSSSN